MTHIITQSELENLNEGELRSTFNRLVNALAFKQQLSFECHLMLASLENIERELYERKIRMFKP